MVAVDRVDAVDGVNDGRDLGNGVILSPNDVRGNGPQEDIPALADGVDTAGEKSWRFDGVHEPKGDDVCD